jgi:hypothetical protein
VRHFSRFLRSGPRSCRHRQVIVVCWTLLKSEKWRTRLSARPATSVFVRVNVGAQNRVHTREMAFPLSLEPFEHVAVNAQMHGGLSARHNDPGAFPEIFADGRGFRRVDPCLTCAASGFSFDRAQRISHGSIFLRHNGSLSLR